MKDRAYSCLGLYLSLSLSQSTIFILMQCSSQVLESILVKFVDKIIKEDMVAEERRLGWRIG